MAETATEKRSVTKRSAAGKTTAAKSPTKSAAAKKAAPKKSTAKKAAPRKSTAKKSTAKAAPRAKAPKSDKAAESPRVISGEERARMIAEAAYYRAEKRGFSGGDSGADWISAEAEIDAALERDRVSVRS